VKLIAGLCLLGLTLVVAPARAELLAYDSFTYDISATTALNGRTGGTGWTSAWTNVPSSSVTALNVTSVGAPLTAGLYTGGDYAVSIPGMSQSSGGIAGSRSFASQTDEVWFSFLFRTPAVVGNDDFLQFSLNNDADQTNSASIGDTDTSATGNKFSVRIGGTNGGTTFPGSKLILGGTDYFLVGRVSKAGASGNGSGTYDLVEMWVDPTGAAAPELASFIVSRDANSNMGAISYFTVRTANFDNTPYYFDELKVGTTYLSVTPEPAALAPLALAAAAILRRRRR
jgi:hypothetical protein